MSLADDIRAEADGLRKRMIYHTRPKGPMSMQEALELSTALLGCPMPKPKTDPPSSRWHLLGGSNARIPVRDASDHMQGDFVNCSADECGEDLDCVAFIVEPGVFDDLTPDQWREIVNPTAFIEYHPIGSVPIRWPNRVPRWSAP